MSSSVVKLLLVGAFAIACNNAGFTSSNTDQRRPQDTPEAPADRNTQDLGTSQDGKANPQKSQTPKPSSATSSHSKAPPGNPTVVRAGHFTVWAEPSRPAFGQAYNIMIEVQIPPNAGTYALSDINGQLSDADSYRQTFGVISKFFPVGSADGYDMLNPDFQVDGDVARLAVQVAAAQRQSVQDMVQVSSKLWNETQTLTVVFK